MSKLTIEETIIKNKKYYRLEYHNKITEFITCMDSGISLMIGMYVVDYRNILKDNGGIFDAERLITYFDNEENVKRAKDKIESMILIERLANK